MRKFEARFSSVVPLPGILTMSVNLLPATPRVDGRQSATALAIARGTTRYLHALGYCVVSELPLPSGRRADLVALGGGGEVLIIEIKSIRNGWNTGCTATGCSSPPWSMFRARFFRGTPD
jgi:hypothetical protein